MPIVGIQKLHPDAVIPEYKTVGSAGADLVAIEDLNILPGEVGGVDTGLSFSFDSNYEIQIRPRSGLAVTNSVTLVNAPATIDSDYRGPIKVFLINHGSKIFRVRKGDRFAQMVLSPVHRADFEELKSLDTTERGKGGFGSTGRN